jgi:hypothetical protein
MADLQKMDREIDQLTIDIGLSVQRLQQLLKKDERYIGQLISLGRSKEFAEKAFFIGDMRNVLGLMASHGFSAHTAARLIRQTPENPVEISTTEEEEDEEQQQQQQHQREIDAPSSLDEASVYPGSSGSSCIKSPSITSSDNEEAVRAKRIKMDPDYQPSETSGGTTPATTTASNSRLPSEEETEEEETTESEDETFVPNDTTEEEIEVAEEEEEEDL